VGVELFGAREGVFVCQGGGTDPGSRWAHSATEPGSCRKVSVRDYRATRPDRHRSSTRTES
jgi:hypothetical protein